MSHASEIIKKFLWGLTFFIVVFSNISPIFAISGQVKYKDKVNNTEKSRFIKGELIVLFNDIPEEKKKEKQLESDLEARFNQPFAVENIELPINGKNISKFSFDPGISIDDAISEVKKNKNVKFVQPNYLYKPQVTTPNDTYYSNQWGITNTKANVAWDSHQGSAGVVTAVIDTGVDVGHEDLSPNIWVNDSEIPGNGIDDDGNGYVDDVNGWNFGEVNGYGVGGNNNVTDSDGHGTHVAGIIGAVGNNGLGVAGVNWNSKIMPVKSSILYEGEHVFPTLSIIYGIFYAVDNGASTINMSIGGDSNEYDYLFDIGVHSAHENNVVTVVAAGNGGLDGVGDDVSTFSPANLSEVITVGAYGSNNSIASFSNWGHRVDVAAPGVNIYSTLPGNNYGNSSGTSMAAPFVAGLSSLLFSKNPNYTNEEIRQIIKTTSFDRGASGWDVNFGRGAIDFDKALNTNPTVLSAHLSSPRVFGGVDYYGTEKIMGTAAGSGYHDYSISRYLGTGPTNSWTTVIGTTNNPAVIDDLLTSIDTRSWVDGVYTLILKAYQGPASPSYSEYEHRVYMRVNNTSPGGANSISITTNKTTIGLGEQIQLNALVYDTEGQLIEGLTPEWTVQGTRGWTIDSAGLLTAGNTSGSYQVGARVGNLVSNTVNVTVNPGQLGRVGFPPGTATEINSVVNQVINFQAVAYDQHDNKISDLQAGDVTWYGGVSSSGSFRPSTPGVYEVYFVHNDGLTVYESPRVSVNVLRILSSPQEFIKVSGSLYLTDTNPATGQSISAGYRVKNTSDTEISISAYLPDYCSTGSVWNSFNSVNLKLNPGEEKWAHFNSRETMCYGSHRVWPVISYNDGSENKFFDAKPLTNQLTSFNYWAHSPKITLDYYYFDTLPPFAGESFNAYLKLTNNEGVPIRLDAAGVAIFSSTHNSWNSMQSTRYDLSFTAGESKSIQYTQNLQQGNYRIWPSVSAGASWFNPKDKNGIENFWSGSVNYFNAHNYLRASSSIYFSDAYPSIGQKITGGYSIYNSSGRPLTISAGINDYNYTKYKWNNFSSQTITIQPYSYGYVNVEKIVSYFGHHRSWMTYCYYGSCVDTKPQYSWINTSYNYWPYKPNIGVTGRTMANYNNVYGTGFDPTKYGELYITVTNYEPHIVYFESSAIESHDRYFSNYGYFFDTNLPAYLPGYSSGTIDYYGNPGPWGYYYATPWVTIGGETFTLSDYYLYDSYYTFSYPVCYGYSCPYY